MSKPSNTADWHNETTGDGEASFIWLHGWGQDLTAFSKLAGLFSREAKNRLFDQPGFGKTPISVVGNGTREYAEELADILKGTGRHVFIGHSFGVRVSIQLAAHHPELVAGIIGIAGAGLQKKRSLAFKLRAKTLQTWGKFTRVIDGAFGTKLRDKFEQRFGSVDYRNAGDMRPTLVKVVNEDLSDTAQQVSCPVCLIYGALDTETPAEFGERYQKLIANSEFHTLEGYDHWDILTRGAYQCEAVMKRFLEKNSLS